MAQCAELTWQMRGQAGKRQVNGAKLGLQHNIGLGGAVVVGLYRLGFPSAKGASVDNKSAGSVGGEGFKVSPYFNILNIAMEEDTDNLVEKFRGIYAFQVTHGPNNSSGTWIINTKVGKGKVIFNGTDKPDVTIIMKDIDAVDLLMGKMQPQKAFFQGKIKVKGNMGLAMKLTDLQKTALDRLEKIQSKL